MIEPTSNISPGQQIRAMDKVSQEKLYSPGMYAMDELYLTAPPPPPPEDDNGGFLGFLGKLTLGAFVICASAVGARKYVSAFKEVDLSNKLMEKASLSEKFKYGVAKFADWLETSIKNIFRSKKNDETPQTTNITPEERNKSSK